MVITTKHLFNSSSKASVVVFFETEANPSIIDQTTLWRNNTTKNAVISLRRFAWSIAARYFLSVKASLFEPALLADKELSWPAFGLLHFSGGPVPKKVIVAK
ncbi:hypothetical protein CEXT_246021 [Caerostris extrusa]|uniref:Uncharacterized protein n=1 Tax=Caerostris extrusa TaxID=172846 RepID=A0AAV4VZ35_CAEEX|nr:hypothetical protein CEXT_246021 [Caerostris extrusa]